MRLVIHKKDSTYLIALSLMAELLSHMVPIGWIVWVSIKAALGCLMVLQARKYFGCYICSVLLSSILAVATYFHAGNTIFYEHLYSMLFYLPLAIVILQGSYRSIALMKTGFLWGLILAVLIFVKGYNSVFYDVSKNFFGSILVLFLFPVAVKIEEGTISRKERKQLLLLSLEFMLVALLAVGRGGILSLGIFVAGNAILYMLSREGTSVWVKCLLALLIIALFSYVVIHPDILQDIFSRFYAKKDTAIKDEPRMIMIEQYINSCSSLRDILLGSNLHNSPLISTYNTNPHNSYIFIHAHYGLAGLLIVVFSILSNIRFSLKRKCFIYLSFILSVVIRIFTDALAGAGLFDVILYYFIFRQSLEIKHAAR